MDIIAYGEEELKGLIDAPGIVVLVNQRPKKPTQDSTILVLEENFEVDSIPFDGVSEALRMRREGWLGATLVVHGGKRFEHELWPMMDQDPLTRSLSFRQLLEMNDLTLGLKYLFGNMAFLNIDRSLIYEDLLLTHFELTSYLSSTRHYLSSFLKSGEYLNLDKEKEAVLNQWESARAFINRRHKKTQLNGLIKRHQHLLEACTTKKQLISEMEKAFSEVLVQLKRQKEARVKTTKSISFLYITELKQNVIKLREILETVEAHNEFKIIHAETPEAAYQVLRNNKAIECVLSDYRFWTEGGKRSALFNGCSIFNHIAKEIGNYYFGYLTGLHDAELLFPTNNVMSQSNVFSKQAILDEKRARETYRLLTFLTKEREDISTDDLWPSAPYSKKGNNSIMRELHTDYFLKANDRIQKREALHKTATELLLAVMRQDIHPARKFLDRARTRPKKEIEKTPYYNMIRTGRLLIFGLLHHHRLLDEYARISCFSAPKKVRRNKFEIIYQLVSRYGSGLSQSPKKHDPVRIAEFFTYFNIGLSCCYDLHDPKALDYMMGEEINWAKQWTRKSFSQHE